MASTPLAIEADPAVLHELLKDAHDLVAEPERWMETPHELLGGVAPIDLVRRGAAGAVRDLLRGIRNGDFT